MFDLLDHLIKQIEFSIKTFGPANGTAGVIDHIREELAECEETPDDLEEWSDVLILALDGAWRCISTYDPDASPEEMAHMIIAKYLYKMNKNKNRKWPDWRTAEPGKAIGHIEEAPQTGCSCDNCECKK